MCCGQLLLFLLLRLLIYRVIQEAALLAPAEAGVVAVVADGRTVAVVINKLKVMFRRSFNRL